MAACCISRLQCCFTSAVCSPACCPTPFTSCCSKNQQRLLSCSTQPSSSCCSLYSPAAAPPLPPFPSCLPRPPAPVPDGWLSLAPPAPPPTSDELLKSNVQAPPEKRIRQEHQSAASSFVPKSFMPKNFTDSNFTPSFIHSGFTLTGAVSSNTSDSRNEQQLLAENPPVQSESFSLANLPNDYLINLCNRLTAPKDAAAISATCIRLYRVSSMAIKELKLGSNPGDSLFRALLVRFNKIRTLDLPLHLGGSFFSDSSCQILANVKPHLVSLNLEKQSNISDVGLMAIANAFPQLEELCCNGCLNITDKGLGAVAGCCQRLRVLRICYCRSLTSASLAVICTSSPTIAVLEISEKNGFAGRWPKLKELTINCDACECSDTVEAVSLNCPQLLSLSLRFCCKLGERFESLRTNSRFLNQLLLDSCTDLPPQIFGAGWPTLTVLHIRTSAIDDITLDAIAKGCRSLRVMRLLSCADITDDGVVKIASSCSMLEVLDVGQCPRVTHSELVACAVGLSPALLQIGLPRQCFGAKHLKAVSRHGWSLDTSSSQWQLVRSRPCLCSSCSLRRTQHVRRSAFLSWEDSQ